VRRAAAAALVLGLVAAACGASRPKPAAPRVALEPLPTAPGAATPGATTPGATASGATASGAAASGAAAAPTRDTAHLNRGPTKRRKAFAAVAAGSGEALAAVAATVSSSASQASGSSGAQFAAAADAICTGYREEVRSTGAHATTLAAQEGELQDLVGETAAALGQLAALSPPPGDGALVRRFVALTRSSVGDFVRAQNRSRSGTTEAATVALEDQDLRLAQASARGALAAQAAARRLGLHVCGSAGAEWL
jgi:hypothetical protein